MTYKFGMFRAFLHYNTQDIERMTVQEYLDNSIILDEVLKVLHAPFLNR